MTVPAKQSTVSAPKRHIAAPKATRAERIEAGVIRTASALAWLESEWNALFAISPAASAPLRFEWVNRWWEIFGSKLAVNSRGLRVLTVRRGTKLIGILPLYLTRRNPASIGPRTLRFISTAIDGQRRGEYFNMLHAPGEEAECMAAIERIIFSRALGWDALHFENIPAGSPLLDLKHHANNHPWTVETSAGETCYASDLTGGMETYLQNVNPNTRKKTQKMLSDLDGAQLKFEIAAGAEQAGQFMDKMVRIQSSLGKSVDRTENPELARFDRAVACALAASGKAIVAQLKRNDDVLAVGCFHRVAHRLECHHSGINFNAPGARAPGVMLHLAQMRRAIEMGITDYDLLSGFNNFKKEYAPKQREQMNLLIRKPLRRAWMWEKLASVKNLRARLTRQIETKSDGRSIVNPSTVSADAAQFLLNNDKPAKPLDGPVSSTIVTTAAELDALREDWRQLFEISPSAAAPLRWEWVANWWRIYGPVYGNNGAGLRTIALRKGTHLIGILPMYESRLRSPILPITTLRFISTGAREFEETCAEYLNLLHAPGEEGACVEELARILSDRSRIAWDDIQFQDMPGGSPLLALAEELGGSGRKSTVEHPGVCYICDLTGGFENYLAALSMTTRRKAKKILHHLDDPEFEFEVAKSSVQAGEYLDELVELHRRRWQAEGHTGSFAPRHLEFHRAMAVDLAAAGEVFLGRLKYQGKVVASSYGHRVGKRFEGYQVGVEHNVPGLRSPGAVLHLAKMQMLFGRGVVHYDQLAGFNSYKHDYARLLRPLVSLTIARKSLCATTNAAADFTRRAARKALGMFSRRLSPIHPTEPVIESAEETNESSDE